MVKPFVGVSLAAVAAVALFTTLQGQAPRDAGLWAPAAPLAGLREAASSVLLADGRVLVLGGRDAEGALSTAEVYAGGAWSASGNPVERWGLTATALADGRVLVAGGESAAGLSALLDIYDPSNGTLTPAGTLSSARKGHGATRLADGRVLIAGGFDGERVLDAVEIFEPETGSVAAAPFSLSVARAGLTATTLLDGRVLLAGGNDGASDLAVAEVVNLASGSVSVRAMSTPRRDHAAVLLPNNNAVLIAGGVSGAGAVATAEVYLPWVDQFRATGAMAQPRQFGTLSALTPESYGALNSRDGSVLSAGGAGVATAELFGFATIKTDKDDYSPGQQVFVSGRGWEPNAEVTLALRELPAEHSSRTFVLTADASGRLVNEFLFDVEDHHLGVRFYLTAKQTGDGVERQAQTTFTDARAWTMQVTPTSVNTAAVQAFEFVATTTSTTNGSSDRLGCVQVTLPPQFTNVSNRELVNPNGWQISGTGQVVVVRAQTSQGRLQQNESVTFRVTATAPATTTGSSFTFLSAGSNTIALSANLCDSSASFPVPTGGHPQVAVTPACTAPQVTSQPTSAFVTYGEDATFTANANGSPNPTVQWQVSSDGGSTWANLTGETSTSLTVAEPAVSLSGNRYRAVFTNACNGTQNATTDSATLTVTARPVTVKANDVTRVYGESTPAFSLALADGSLAAGEALSVLGTPLFAPAGTTVGSHAIDVSGLDNTNYVISYAVGAARGQLTVTARPVTVKANDVTRVYGESTPGFSYTVSAGSIVGDDSFGAPVFTPAGNTVGSHAIVLSGLANSNYQVSFSPGILTITARPISVRAQDKQKVLGEPDPLLTYEISSGSLVYGDSFGGELTRLGGQTVGSYSIQQGTLTAGPNYNLTFIAGTLRIEYAPATSACLGSPGRTILQPVNAAGTSVFKQGSTVPAKFRVCDAYGNSIGTSGVVTYFQQVSVSAGTVSVVNEGVESTTPDTAFRWSPTDQQWIFNMNTKGLKANQTYTFRVTLNDGTWFTFGFGLR